jgi:hypothetical protein
VNILRPILLAGSGRTGSTAIMSVLGSHPQVALDREFPYESRYLTLFVKFALLLQHPDFFTSFDEEKLFDPNYLGFGGHRPGTASVAAQVPSQYLPMEQTSIWVRTMWEKFSSNIFHCRPQSLFYAEKAPLWLAPRVRYFFECFTLYNVRDPRDIFISANAFMKKRNALGFGRAAGDSDRDHARRLALAFLCTFENYYADRDRKDVLLVRYEDFVLHRTAVTDKICRLTGLSPFQASQEEDTQLVDSHTTAADREGSVARWRSEPIAEDVVRLLEQILQEEMILLGYPLSLASGPSAVRTISFSQSRVNPVIRFSRHGCLLQKPEYALAHVRGHDFHIYLPLEPFPAEHVKEVWVCIQGDIGNHFSLYWRRRDTRFSENASIHVPCGPSPAWSVVPFSVGRHPEWRGEITKLRLDLFNNFTQPHRGIGRIRWVRLVG